MICYNCFKEFSGGSTCPNCGFEAAAAEGRSPMALRAGAILNGRYVIGRVLGQGGFGITYLALDDRNKARVTIKEYFPAEFASRSGGSHTVTPYPGEREESFFFGMKQFREEARSLSAFRDNARIVRILGYFEENGTAYCVTEYVDGESLSEYVKNCGGRLFPEEADELLLPLMDAMEQLHAKGLQHRDIAPDNVLVLADGTTKLIEFGTARHSTGEQSKSLDVGLRHGFAPYEQYTRRGQQGTFTDVYAMAATYYYAVTGRVPPDAMERSAADELIPPRELGVKLPERTEAALLRALSLQAEDRFQTMGEFRDAMLGKTPAAPVRQRREAARSARQTPAPARERREKRPAREKAAPAASRGSRLLPAIIIAGAILLSAVILAVVLQRRTAPAATPAAAPAPTAEATPVPETEPTPPEEAAPTSEPNEALPTVDPSFSVTPEPGEEAPGQEAPPSMQPALPGVELTPEPEPTPEPAPEGQPGLEDMKDCDKRIAKPSPSSWLPAYAVRYVDVPHDDGAYLHADPSSKSGHENRLDKKIPEQTKVILLAEENGFGLIKVDNKCVGWIRLEYLVEAYANAVQT